MSFKEFFKPTTGKIILTILLFIVLNFFYINLTLVLDGGAYLAGLPLGFTPEGSCGARGSCPQVTFSWINFIINILFWYLISCIALHFYNKIRKHIS